MTVSQFSQNFWSKVGVRGTDECWEWQGSRFTQGYGSVPLGKKRKKAHRVAYRLAVGKFPTKLCVLHTCDNPPCVNPAHLFLGTQDDNMKDMARKQRGNSGYRGVTRCIHGHAFTEVNTYLRHGRRRCKTCRANATKRSNSRKRDRARRTPAYDFA